MPMRCASTSGCCSSQSTAFEAQRSLCGVGRQALQAQRLAGAGLVHAQRGDAAPRQRLGQARPVEQLLAAVEAIAIDDRPACGPRPARACNSAGMVPLLPAESPRARTFSPPEPHGVVESSPRAARRSASRPGCPGPACARPRAGTAPRAAAWRRPRSRGRARDLRRPVRSACSAIFTHCAMNSRRAGIRALGRLPRAAARTCR